MHLSCWLSNKTWFQVCFAYHEKAKAKETKEKRGKISQMKVIIGLIVIVDLGFQWEDSHLEAFFHTVSFQFRAKWMVDIPVVCRGFQYHAVWYSSLIHEKKCKIPWFYKENRKLKNGLYSFFFYMFLNNIIKYIWLLKECLWHYIVLKAKLPCGSIKCNGWIR